jgi:hypothetical protein
MKKTILVTAISLCIGVHPANAGLIGMPLNLKVAIDAVDANAPACQFFTDEVLTGPVLIKSC